MDDDFDQQTPLVDHAFYRPGVNSKMNDLGTLGGLGSSSWAWDISNGNNHPVSIVGMRSQAGPGRCNARLYGIPRACRAILGSSRWAMVAGGHWIPSLMASMTIHRSFTDRPTLYQGPEIVGESNGEAFYSPEPGGPMFFLDANGVGWPGDGD